MKSLHELTELQLLVLTEIWNSREATVLEVHQALEERTGLARKTIATLMTRLEQYGLLKHREDGREYVYRATVTRAEVRQATVGKLLGTLFQGNVEALVSHALEARDVAPDDLARVRRLLDSVESGSVEP